MKQYVYYLLKPLEAGSVPIKGLVVIDAKHKRPKYYRKIKMKAYARVIYYRMLSDAEMAEFNLVHSPKEDSDT